MDNERAASLREQDFRRILLVKPSSLGDIIHALPVLHGLRVRYPEASISWLVGRAFAPLIDGHPDLDEVISFDRKRYSRLARGVAPSVEFIEFVHAVRARRFDLAIDLQGLFRSGFLTFATGAPIRLGFAAARELAWMFYTHRVAVAPGDRHAVDKNLLIGGALGFGETAPVIDLAVTDAERTEAAGILAGVGLDPDQPFLAVWPGARWETKRWSPSRFAEVIDGVAGGGELAPVLMGDSTERALCDEIAGACHADPMVLAGDTNIRQAVAVLDRAAVVLAHDSAPMHIAAALRRPLVAILGPTNPERTGPYGRISSVVQADLECTPCYLKRLTQCPYDLLCMRETGVDDVLRRIEMARSSRLGRPGEAADSGGAGREIPHSRQTQA